MEDARPGWPGVGAVALGQLVGVDILASASVRQRPFVERTGELRVAYGGVQSLQRRLGVGNTS